MFLNSSIEKEMGRENPIYSEVKRYFLALLLKKSTIGLDWTRTSIQAKIMI